MGSIEVVEYDPDWLAVFDAEKADLLSLLGNLVEDVHHVGSTAVVGLRAKPKIDIDAVIRDEGMLADAVERVKAIPKYTFHGTPYSDGMWTFTFGRGSRGNRLYLCGPNNATHEKRILFRDWLRSHPDDAADYAALKCRLATEANGDWAYYTGGKTAFVATIVSMASRQRT
ncbi:protein of unknown function UPF0157 [Rhizobium sp. PDO1-076]|uniref:GrpB family protein n=1 Tax=Rhizobium sp. PDO1-076 TaxID=1125979 RepID=UPI00024E32F3|nr:GrpB family protein [Rhizobium sp. PDO1-076]EHS49085.1 protein of unknown function UPF0157 [Rhizobium sp. PDO1-076]